MLFRLTILLILISTIGAAQDNSNFSHYFMNPYSINPSFAGTDGRGSLFLTYRLQWSGIEGAPKIANFSYHTPVGNKLGFGVNVTNAERGVLNTSSAVISNSVGIKLTDKFILRFGASVGAASNSVDLSQLDNIDPNILPDITDGAAENNLYLIGSAGVSIQAKHFNFGVSIPNLFQDEFYTSESFTVSDIAPLENLLIFASNRFYFSKKKKHLLEPYILYRYSDVLPPLLEASLLVHLNHTVWFGGSYRQDFGVSALGGIKLNKVFGLGYSYSIQNSGDNEINSPTHEVQLNLLLGGRKKKRLVYSFVDSALPKKKSKRQLALEERRKKLEEQRKLALEQKKIEEEQQAKEEEQAKAEKAAIEAKQEAEAAAKAKAESEKTAIEKEEQAKAQLAKQKAAEEENNKQLAEERARMQEQNEPNQSNDRIVEPKNEPIKEVESVSVDAQPAIIIEDSEPMAEKESLPANESTSTPKKNLIDEHTSNERVKIKRGGHLLELQKGEYVIVGVFESYEHAEEYSDNLFFRGYQSKFGYISQEGYWYVYVFESTNIEEARNKRDELRRKRIFSKAWVITIE